MSARLRQSLLVTAIVVLGIAAAWSRPLTAPAPEGVYLEEMTWVEVRALVEGGKTLAIVPTGGVEQNGPRAFLRLATRDGRNLKPGTSSHSLWERRAFTN